MQKKKGGVTPLNLQKNNANILLNPTINVYLCPPPPFPNFRLFSTVLGFFLHVARRKTTCDVNQYATN